MRTVIVDDEPLSRQRIRDLLGPHRDFEVVGEAEDGIAAIETIEKLRPDVVFLDVQMPGLSGLDALREIENDPMPIVVFATAFDKYAIDAFERRAVDYLLKPIEAARFADTIDRIRKTAAGNDTQWTERIRELTKELRGPQYRQRIVVKANDRIFFVSLADVEWIESAGNYARFHVAKKGHLVRNTMQHLEAELDPQKFVRIHRGTIVNLDHLQELEQIFRGEVVAVMKSGLRLPVQRPYRERLLASL